MIKINLLGKPTGPEPRPEGQSALLFSLIVVATLIGLVWWYLHLKGQIDKLEADKAAALEEKKRLEAVIKEVEGYEAQKKALETKVQVIDNLKKNQTGPVHMLDEISKNLPDFLWLDKLTQQAGNNIRLEGKATSYNAIADFITNLDRSGYFVNIGVVNANRLGDARELYQYTISATFRPVPVQPASSTTTTAPKPRT